jgi:plastocyanin
MKHHMKRFRRHYARAVVVWLGCVIGGGVPAMPSAGWAKEVVFIAREVEDQQAVWLPGEIIIHRGTDFTEPLIFRFENPTERTHVFEALGLFESVEESGVQITRPVRITIAPEGTEQSVIDRDRMASDATAAEGERVTYRFYCPLHRADADMGGRIVVGQ